MVHFYNQCFIINQHWLNIFSKVAKVKNKLKVTWKLRTKLYVSEIKVNNPSKPFYRFQRFVKLSKL